MIEKFSFEEFPKALVKEKGEELTPQEIREKLEDPSYLPSREEIFKAFYVKKAEGRDEMEWFLSEEGERAWHNWHNFCDKENDPVFELWTKEYIQAFSDYLSQRAKDLGGKKEKPISILEVGAGNGKLTHFLNREFERKKIENIKIIATDSGEWMEPRKGKWIKITPHFPVEILDYKEALKEYKPDIVVCSWMPLGEDWTKDFRDAESIKEYILIGEADQGCCGHPWETWGAEPDYCPIDPKEIVKEIEKFRERMTEKEVEILMKIKELEEKERTGVSEEIEWELIQQLAEEREKRGVGYKNDGFKRIDLKELKKFQICRTDDVWKGIAFYSSTVSFRREIPKENLG
jgi:hypothetical protein